CAGAASDLDLGVHFDAIARIVIVVDLDFDFARTVGKDVVVSADVPNDAAAQNDVFVILVCWRALPLPSKPGWPRLFRACCTPTVSPPGRQRDRSSSAARLPLAPAT